MKLRYALALAAAGLAAACLTPTEGCGCPPALGLVNVAGTVSRAGQPLPRAPIVVSVSTRGCDAAPRRNELVDSPRQRADTAGRFAFLARAAVPSDTACVQVTALDTVGERPDSVVGTAARVRLVQSYGTSEQPRTVRFDLRF
jgi:hypothetical protein